MWKIPIRMEIPPIEVFAAEQYMIGTKAKINGGRITLIIQKIPKFLERLIIDITKIAIYIDGARVLKFYQAFQGPLSMAIVTNNCYSIPV